MQAVDYTLRTYFGRIGALGRNSSQAAVAFHADEARHVEFARRYGLPVAQVPGEQIPNRLVRTFFGHGGPGRDLVGLTRFDRTLPDAQVADASAPSRARVAAVAHSAEPHPVTALLVVRIRIEQVVADVLQVRLDGLAGHPRHDDAGIGDRGLVHDLLVGDRRAGHNRRSPAESGRQGDLRALHFHERIE